MVMISCKTLLQSFLFFFFITSSTISATPFDYPTANLSTSWANTASAPHSVAFSDGSKVRATLLRGTYGPKYACGFFCNGKNCDQNYIFAIFIVQTNSASMITSAFPQVVWSANRNNPVKINSSLDLSSNGDLILKDADGKIAWSTNTGGKGVVGLNLTETGNLVLFNSKNKAVWDSFDHPTDALVLGQKLVSGQKLTAGLFTLTTSKSGLLAYVGSNPPQTYYDQLVSGTKKSKSQSYVKYVNGSLSMYILNSEPNEPDMIISVPLASSAEAQYMKLGSDGHLRVYEWQVGWREVADLLTGYLGQCAYPMACGQNGICSNGQCSCPKSKLGDSNYFKPINDRRPDYGCEAVTPLVCQASKNHKLIELDDINYFTYGDDIQRTDIETCKSACLKKCACKAALFRYGTDSSSGDCYMPSQLFTMMDNDREKTHYNATAYVKVQV